MALLGVFQALIYRKHLRAMLANNKLILKLRNCQTAQIVASDGDSRILGRVLLRW